jgi:hypothetical protein
VSTGTAERADAVSRLVRETVGRVDAIAPDAMRAVLPFLKRARDELQAELQTILEGADPDERFTTYQRTLALRGLEATFDRIAELDPAMAKALGIGRSETGQLAVSALDDEVRRLSAIFGDGVPHLPQLDQAAIIAKGDRLLWKRHTQSAGRYAGAIGDDIKAQFAIGLAKGETFSQLAQRMRKLDPSVRAAAGWSPPDDANAISDAMFHRWRHWADRVIRTENMHAYNTQHDLAIDQLEADRDEDEEPWLRRWDASADRVTCERCKALDRTVTTVGGEFRWGYKCPPAHPYCRCTILAWRASWGDMKGEVPSVDAEGKDIAPKPHLPRESKPKRERKPDTGGTTLREGEWTEQASKGSGERWRNKKITADHGDLFDDKGRRIGGHATISDFGEGERPRDLPRYRVWVGGTRDGERYGAGERSKDFTTLEEAMAHARAQLEKQGKAYRKRTSTKDASPVPAKPAAPRDMVRENHDAALEAAKAGKVGDYRQRTDDAFRAKGYAPHDTTTPSATTARVPNLERDSNAAGLHYLQTGKIEINGADMDRAEWFAKKWAEDPAAARAALLEYQGRRTAFYSGKAGNLDETGLGAQLHRAGRSYKVMVHESLHGFGATMMGDYQGVGGKIEEITTEVLARRTMREQFGADYTAIMHKGKAQHGGAYEKEIQQAIKGIRDATGVSHDKALRLLEEAADEYKRTARDATRLPHERIAESVAKRLPPKREDQTKPARYDARRDGSTPTEWESGIGSRLWRALNQ